MIPRIAHMTPEEMRDEAEAHEHLARLCKRMAEWMQQEDEQGELDEVSAQNRDTWLFMIEHWETVLLRLAETRLKRGIKARKAGV